MHDRLYRHQAALTDADLERHAGEVGLDLERFRRSLNERVHEVRIREDLASAAQSGARGTPSLFINGERYTGSHERAALIDALARAAMSAAR